MEKYVQKFQEKLNKTGRHFVFPTEKPKPHEELDGIIDKVKEIVSTYTTESIETTRDYDWTTPGESPTTIQQEASTAIQTETTIISEIFTETNRTMTEILNNGTISDFGGNSTILPDLTNSIGSNRTTLPDLINSIGSNSTILPELTNSTGSNNTMLEILKNGTNAILEVITSSNKTTDENSTDFETTTHETKLFDWSEIDSDSNLTFIHTGLPEMKPDGDQTAFIILGVVLGVLIAASFVLLLIYLSYKRSNFYTLQERASSSHQRPIPLHASSTDGSLSEKDTSICESNKV